MNIIQYLVTLEVAFNFPTGRWVIEWIEPVDKWCRPVAHAKVGVAHLAWLSLAYTLCPPCPQRGGHFFARAQIWGAAKYPSLISERDSVRAPVEAVSMLPKYNHRGFAGRYKHLGLIVQLQGGPMKKFLIAVCSIVLAIGVSGCVGKAPVGKGKAPAPVVTRG